MFVVCSAGSAVYVDSAHMVTELWLSRSLSLSRVAPQNATPSIVSAKFLELVVMLAHLGEILIILEATFEVVLFPFL